MSKARARVSRHQIRSKQHFDSNPKVKHVEFHVGDLIKVRLPRLVVKGRSAFSRPFKVVKVNKKSLVTQDGRCWGFKRVCPYMGTHNVDGAEEETDESPCMVGVSPQGAEPNHRDRRGSGLNPQDRSTPTTSVGPLDPRSDDIPDTIANRVKHDPRARVPSRKVMEGCI